MNKPIPAITDTFKKILQLAKWHDNNNPLHADHCVNCQELNQLIDAHNAELLNERERILDRFYLLAKTQLGIAEKDGKVDARLFNRSLKAFLAELKEGGE